MKLSGGGTINSSSQIGNGVIINEDINASAAIAYSKLALSNSIVNADVAAGAAITHAKMESDARARANHTGTQLASTISDFNASAAAAVPGAPTIVYKGSDETVTADTALTADSVLKFAMTANKTYRIKIFALILSNADAMGFKCDLTGPGSPTRVAGWGLHSLNNPATTAIGTAMPIKGFGSYGDSAMTIDTGAASIGHVYYELIVANGANAGDFSFRWAQNVSDAASCTVYGSSFLEYKQLD